MSLPGRAVIASWSHVDMEARPRVRDWHTREHIPERLCLPGFLRARRYCGVGDAGAFFILYDAADLRALTSTAYLARLNDPTPWTRRSVVELKRSVRGVCRVIFSRGSGVGGVIGTIRLDAQSGEQNFLDDDFVETILGWPSIVGLHICRADIPASTVQTVEAATRDVAAPDVIILVEGLTAEAVSDAIAAITGYLPVAAISDCFRLEYLRERAGGI